MLRVIFATAIVASLSFAPYVHAGEVEQWQEPTRSPLIVSYDRLRGVAMQALQKDDSRVSRWKTEVQYSDRIESSEALPAEKRGERKRKMRFAAVQRVFGDGHFKPLLGFGASDKFNVKAVVGGAIQFSERMSASIKYGLPLTHTNASLPNREDGAETMSFSFQVKLH